LTILTELSTLIKAEAAIILEVRNLGCVCFIPFYLDVLESELNNSLKIIYFLDESSEEITYAEAAGKGRTLFLISFLLPVSNS